VNLVNFEVSASSKLLTFEGTEEQFELAVNDYNATLINRLTERKTA
jgi:hypothetical protein